MGLQAEVDVEADAVRRITSAARRSPCSAFADLLWPPIPDLSELMRLLEGDPGVMFESPRRIVVFQRIGGKLRYYAGGWRSDQSRIVLEQDRIAAEGYEMGVFASVRDALAFAVRYLVQEKRFAAVTVPRKVLHPERG